jgi:hypothetical protein
MAQGLLSAAICTSDEASKDRTIERKLSRYDHSRHKNHALDGEGAVPDVNLVTGIANKE